MLVFFLAYGNNIEVPNTNIDAIIDSTDTINIPGVCPLSNTNPDSSITLVSNANANDNDNDNTSNDFIMSLVLPLLLL